MAEQWNRDSDMLTTDPNAVDVGAVHAFLQQSHWARGIPPEVVRRSMESSLNFSLLREQRFIGYARVITDYTTFAYLTDVFVLAEYRGQGLATWMMSCILAHPRLQGLRRWCLVTRDAKSLYERVGFEQTPTPDRWMERLDPHVYEVDVLSGT